MGVMYHLPHIIYFSSVCFLFDLLSTEINGSNCLSKNVPMNSLWFHTIVGNK